MRELIALVVAAFALVACTAPSLQQPGSTLPNQVFVPQLARDAGTGITALPAGCQWAQVTSVVDGDTIRIAIAGTADRVRYIGVDTPETVDPRTGVQPFGPEASALNSELVAGKMVCLERDITERDRFGRLLRYVWLEDGTFVNEALLAAGLAVVSTFPPDVKYIDSRFLPAQREAQEHSLGIWGEPPKPVPTLTPTIGPGGNCDPSYPGVCIPPPPPDLDCGDIELRQRLASITRQSAASDLN